MDNEIVKEMVEYGLNEKPFGEKFIFATYLISQKKKKGNSKRRFGSLIDLLPDNYDEFPYMYHNDDLRHLEGSPILEKLTISKDLMEGIYKIVCTLIPKFKEQPYQELLQTAVIVSSRCFSVKIKNVPTTVMVPFANMFNHQSYATSNTKWGYNEQMDCFTVEAIKDIGANEELSFSYGEEGRKIQDYFLCYGFVPRDMKNGQSVSIVLELDGSDKRG
jgi:hypothetical protein